MQKEKIDYENRGKDVRKPRTQFVTANQSARMFNDNKQIANPLPSNNLV